MDNDNAYSGPMEQPGHEAPPATEKAYIGAKIIRARPMTSHEFKKQIKGEDPAGEENAPGYLVKYPDGYESWSPKNVFENAYREILVSEAELI